LGPLDPALFGQPSPAAARALIGCGLYVDGVGGLIVEAEAYDHEDPASHAFVGPTARNAAMFGPVGHAYVYLIYGMYWCLNFVCGEQPGSAVLIRALEPDRGIGFMQERRGLMGERQLCSGPGKLCQALGVTRADDRRPLVAPRFELTARGAEPEISVGPRIGLTKAAEVPWRFGLKGSPYLSKPFPRSL
jgi:DNA-3-methyladenine glycosylase